MDEVGDPFGIKKKRRKRESESNYINIIVILVDNRRIEKLKF